MNLIDRYVKEVGENLLAKDRADIETEIRSLIEDTLEGRSQAEGRAVDDAMIVEVLKEFGPPAKMAASYLPPRYLIGPRLFPTFLMVMRIVLVMLVVVAMVNLGVAISEPELTLNEITTSVGQALIGFITTALPALGNVVFIFALLELLLPRTDEKEKDWDPRQMKSREDPEVVRPLPLIWEIFFTLVAMLVFNLYPMWIGIPLLLNGDLSVVPFFSEAFFRFVPWFTAVWALQIALNAFLLRAGRWETWTRWFQMGLKAMDIVILAMMIAGPSIVDFSLTGMNLSPDVAGSLEMLSRTGTRAFLVFLLVLTGVEMFKLLYRLLLRRNIPAVVIE